MASVLARQCACRAVCCKGSVLEKTVDLEGQWTMKTIVL